MSSDGSDFRPNFTDDSGDIYSSDEYIPPPLVAETSNPSRRSEVPPHDDHMREDGTLVRTFFPPQLPTDDTPPTLKRLTRTPPPDDNMPETLIVLRLASLAVLGCLIMVVLVLSTDDLRPQALDRLLAVRGAQPAGAPALSEKKQATPTAMPSPTLELTRTVPPPTSTSTPEPTLNPLPEGKVFVPGGTFTMGLTGIDNAPAHQVMVNPFYIDAYEVTNADWQTCVAANACSEPQSLVDYSGQPYYTDPALADYPVTSITWFDAASYCAWAGGRLPTEAEWEMAARWNPATQEVTLYPWGDNPQPKYANTCGAECPLPGAVPTQSDSYSQAAPVGSFPQGVSAVGAYDMVGNAAEWVADWYGPYPQEAVTNPLGPDLGERKVVRGGAWGVPLSNVNSVVRSRFTPDSYSVGLGVRCVEDKN